LPQQLDFERMRHELMYAPQEYVVFGSTVMYLHGLREQIGDVDMFVSPWLYDVLYYAAGWQEFEPVVGHPPYLEGDFGIGVPVHAFAAWDPTDWGVCRDACFRHAELVEGLVCAPLWVVRAHKASGVAIIDHRAGVDLIGSKWEKHLHDLARIDGALQEAA
jgi:hypothetical protein